MKENLMLRSSKLIIDNYRSSERRVKLASTMPGFPLTRLSVAFRERQWPKSIKLIPG